MVKKWNGLLNGLLVYWPMNEVSGNRADLHTNGYHLTESGTLPTEAGLVYANAGHFQEGVDNCLKRTRASSPLINFGANSIFTISVWCNPGSFVGGPDSPNYYKFFYNGGGGPFGGGYQFFTTSGGTGPGGGGQLYVALGNNGGVPGDIWGWHTGLSCTINVWQLVTFTYNDVTKAGQMYINTGAPATETNTHPFTASTETTFLLMSTAGSRPVASEIWSADW